MIAKQPSSSIHTTRASSKPHCSLSTPFSGASSGSVATRQPSTPFAERATVRCEMPVSVSTRTSRTVSPSTSDGGRVEDDIHRSRPVLRREERIAGVPCEELAPLRRHTAVLTRIAAQNARQTGGVEHELRAMERERRLGAFVLVHVGLAETVAATAGREVVQGPAETVAPEEPLECALRAGAVLGIAGDGKCSQLGLDERGGVERLLVACAGGGLVATAPLVAGQPQQPVGEPRFVAEPRKRLEAGCDGLLALERGAAEDQRVRQARVVVGERVLEPAPTVVRARLVRLLELGHAALEQLPCRILEPVGVEPCEAERRVGGRSNGELALERAHERCEQPLRRADDRRAPTRRRERRRAPRSSDRHGRRRAARRASAGRSS